ncbi:hypothetical protein ZWY2020_014106 [Hordeum vulgare]|nr:hypothetical protein ZWY2020_014106 [Hordeum vulgare]
MKSTSSASGAAPSSQPASSRAKKMDRVESSLKDASRELSLAKLKSGAVVAAVLFVVFGLLNSLFEGRAVAKLPFAPVPLVQRMSHRSLPGTTHRLRHGLPLLPLLHEHTDQPPEAARLPPPRSRQGRRWPRRHARSQSQLSLLHTCGAADLKQARVGLPPRKSC